MIDHKINMTTFDALRKNDAAGAPAYDPRVMLKIVLAAYARGMISSREIAFACQQNVVFMALSARSVPRCFCGVATKRSTARWGVTSTVGGWD